MHQAGYYCTNGVRNNSGGANYYCPNDGMSSRNTVSTGFYSTGSTNVNRRTSQTQCEVCTCQLCCSSAHVLLVTGAWLCVAGWVLLPGWPPQHLRREQLLLPRRRILPHHCVEWLLLHWWRHQHPIRPVTVPERRVLRGGCEGHLRRRHAVRQCVGLHFVCGV